MVVVKVGTASVVVGEKSMKGEKFVNLVES
jgi:hypothetical protein